MNLDCIAQYLINAGLATQLGVDVFEHHMPEDAKHGLLLKPAMEGIPINSYVKDYFNGRFQVIVRAPRHGAADNLAMLICKTLSFTDQTFLDASGNLLMHVLLSRAVSLPIVYPRSPGNIYEWSCNFYAHYIMPFQTAPVQIPNSVRFNSASQPIIVQS